MTSSQGSLSQELPGALGALSIGTSRKRRTRIVATIGPASSSTGVLEGLVAAGMDVARVSFAHGSIDDALEVIRRIRSVAPHLGILPDLPGPKIRSTAFPDGGVVLETNSEVLLVRGSVAPE